MTERMHTGRANRLLVDYYESSYDAHGKPEALRRLKEVVVKGVKLLVEMPRATESEHIRTIVDKVRSGRAAEVVEGVAATVQDQFKGRKGGFLTAVKLAEQGAVLAFLPDVDIEDTPDNRRRWAAFLTLVAPRNRRGLDPVTRLAGRIPYRDGAWLSDLGFRPGVPPELIEEITSVAGSLCCDTKAHLIDREIAVGGNLYVKAALAASATSPVSRLEGDLHLYGEQKGQLKHPGYLSLPPARLKAWGLRDGNKLVLGDRRRYVAGNRQVDGREVDVLVEVEEHGPDRRSVPRRYFWDGSQWKELAGRLPMDTANKVRVTLNKFPVYMGLGKDFLVNHTDKIQDNISRLIALMDICLGVYNPESKSALTGAHQQLFTETANTLDKLSALVSLTGDEDEFEIEKTVGRIHELLDSLDDENFHLIKDGLNRPMPAIDLARVRRDMEYLAALAGEDVDVNKVLGTAGRTLVYLNNVFLSREAKARAAALISPVRKLLRDVAPKKEADRMLIAMLRQSRNGMLKRLRRSYPDKGDEIGNLSLALKDMEANSPVDMIREFTARDYEGDSVELIFDRDFLLKMLQFGEGPVDELFRWTRDDGSPYYDLDKFKNALWVNLQSFIVGEVRRKDPDYEERSPTEIARLVLDKLAFLAPIIKVYNNAIAGTA